MRALARHFVPSRISWQIAALVLISLVPIHAIFTAAFLLHRPPEQHARSEPGPGRLVTLVRLIAPAPAEERARLVADVAQAYPDLDLRLLESFEVPASAGQGPGWLGGLRRHLGEGFELYPISAEGSPERLVVRLPDGAAVSAKMQSDWLPPFPLIGPWTTTLLFLIFSVALLVLWAARTLTAPLSAFARAAESFSLDGTSAALPERGPDEVRSVARAFNRMRERITNLVEDRTRMLAAIGHDLRTPITRLRLRSEFIEDENQRRHMLHDLDQMKSMLEAVLTMLRDGRRQESVTSIDLATSLQLICDQFADLAYRVAYDGPEHMVIEARPDDLHRAVTNLVENAVRYGTRVDVRLRPRETSVTIEIEDDGPGIADAKKQSVLEPFVRGDEARNMNGDAGFGLGLSIACAVAWAHGGGLTLHDRPAGGLIARIDLPLRAQDVPVHMRPM